ncbi:MAG: PilZ domain-containing protein [candidate division NC10 bacterium]
MEWPADRRYPRIKAYLPARCTIYIPGSPPTCIDGKTRDVSPGGAMLLLATYLPRNTRLMVHLGEGPEVRSQVAWAGKVLLTDLGTVTGHGIAFTRDLDTSGLKQILNGTQKQRHGRVPTRFFVEYTDLEKSGVGSCLNLSQNGMFVATADPLCTGQDLLVHVSPPGLLHTFSLWSRVVWSNRVQSTNSFPAGFGVRFLTMQPTEAMGLSHLLEKLQAGTAPLVSASTGSGAV